MFNTFCFQKPEQSPKGVSLNFIIYRFFKSIHKANRKSSGRIVYMKSSMYLCMYSSLY